ncbi:MAG: hypothetical protein Q8909_05645 [Bacteroidota bacterium]|nr:hypothetical protein [Bacteroidota bacterium]
MKTIDKLIARLQKAQSLTERIAIRIQIIELNRNSENSNKKSYSIKPITDFLERVQKDYTNQLELYSVI